jgi:hypothetical protein
MQMYQLPQSEAFHCTVKNCKHGEVCAAVIPVKRASVHPTLTATFEEYPESVMLRVNCETYEKQEG